MSELTTKKPKKLYRITLMLSNKVDDPLVNPYFSSWPTIKVLYKRAYSSKQANLLALRQNPYYLLDKIEEVI